MKFIRNFLFFSIFFNTGQIIHIDRFDMIILLVPVIALGLYSYIEGYMAGEKEV